MTVLHPAPSAPSHAAGSCGSVPVARLLRALVAFARRGGHDLVAGIAGMVLLAGLALGAFQGIQLALGTATDGFAAVSQMLLEVLGQLGRLARAG